MDRVEILRSRIENLEAELHHLKDELKIAEETPAAETSTPWKWPLTADEYERYQRQLILTQVGVKGQIRLRETSVLIVGVGGLGCPAAAYLAGAGVGTIGLVDGDTVEVSNLHRQILHSTDRVGMSKVDSAICYLRGLNPTLVYHPHRTHLEATTAADIIAQYDIVLDCTDHPTSRYLISDACVLLEKPLIFASALRTHGQLMVMNYPARPQGDAKGGPCYRCVFPKPSPPDAVVSCGEGGILGPVVGTMGIMQALNAINIIADGRFKNPDLTIDDLTAPSMLLFSGHVPTPFRTIMMAGRKPNCFACGAESELTLETLRAGMVDYVKFCGVVAAPIDVLKPEERISPAEYARRAKGKDEHMLLDVREAEHYNIANLDGAINVPFRELMSESEGQEEEEEGKPRGDNLPEWFPAHVSPSAPIYVVCRQGEDSQHAAKRLKEMGLDKNGERFIGDIKGGMKAWKEEVDPTLPFT